ncbi:MAG: FHA domain-containing protein [Chloroflexi bacterium]|nr:FHA domain-containing protein [Chloroflexota bacterium]
MTDTIGFDLFILVLRIAFIFLLYFFIFLVVRTISRELNRPSQRADYAQPGYHEENYVSPPVSGPIPQPGGPTGRLVVTDAGNATSVRSGEIFQPGPIMPIGRLPGNALVLDDDYVSSEHALLAWREGRWWLSDVASTNGTFLNGQQVTRPVQVNWGDLIGVGGVRLRLEP